MMVVLQSPVVTGAMVGDGRRHVLPGTGAGRPIARAHDNVIRIHVK